MYSNCISSSFSPSPPLSSWLYLGLGLATKIGWTPKTDTDATLWAGRRPAAEMALVPLPSGAVESWAVLLRKASMVTPSMSIDVLDGLSGALDTHVWTMCTTLVVSDRAAGAVCSCECKRKWPRSWPYSLEARIVLHSLPQPVPAVLPNQDLHRSGRSNCAHRTAFAATAVAATAFDATAFAAA